MNRLRDRLGRAGTLMPVGAGGFLAWWGTSLSAWLPERWRHALGLGTGHLLLQPGVEGVQLRLQQGAEIRDLAHLPPLPAEPPGTGSPTDTPGDPLARVLSARAAELPRALLLPPSVALRRELVLPAAAAERLRDVVGFEIDRQTPFTADAVVFDARVLRRRDAQLDAELVAVPRQAMEAHLARLGPMADTLAGVDVAGADGVPVGINLLPVERRYRRPDPWRVWNWALAGIAVVGLGFALWQVLDNRTRAADALEQRLERDAAPARRAAAQRQQLVSLIEGQAFLDNARRTRPAAVEVIDELSRRLPDGTYLEKLAIEEDRLTVIGLSNEAPALIGRLQGSPLWRSPALTGALQPDTASGRDRFTLGADIGPSAPAKEAARGNARSDR
ncbi:PilN domain-containing protein [Lysobacter olei]